MRFSVAMVGALLLLWSRPGCAQGSGSGGLVATMGYAMPAPRAVAPGQVISLFLRATGSAPAEPLLASGAPLSAEQAGFAVVLEQSTAVALVEVPLLGVSRAESCYGMLPCTPLTILTVQIPWELRPNFSGQGRPDNFVSLWVRAAGSEASEVFPVRPVRDAIHIVSNCEESPFLQAPPESPAGEGVCRSRVTHADGRLVTAANPAAAGETVLVHGVGFGTMEGRPETGFAASVDLAVENVQMALEFGSNLAGRQPDATATATTGILKAGQFGMYVVAVTVPEVPSGTPACTASRIQSNVTVSIGRLDSFAGAAFCVDTGAEP